MEKKNENITVKSQWRKVQELLQNEEAFNQLAKIDRLTVFEDYVKDLERKENEEKQLEKMQIRRQERKNRDAFRELLNEMAAKDLINLRTRWKNLFPIIKEDLHYLAVINQSGSTARDIFDDKIEELETQFDEEKRKVKNVMKEKGFSFTTKTTLEEFVQFLLDAKIEPGTTTSAPNSMDISTLNTNSQTILLPGSIQPINIKVLYEEFVDRATSKEKSEDKKKRKTFDSFKELLKSLKQITPTSQLIDIIPLVQENDAYKVLTSEEHELAFTEYLEYLQKKI